MVANEQQLHALTQTALTICVCLSFFTLSIGTAPLAICSLAAIVIWLLSGNCYKNRAEWVSQDWMLPLILLLLLPWFGMLWSSAPVVLSVKFAERSHYWLFAFVAASVMKSERTLRNVLVCYISGTAIMAIVRFLYSQKIIPQTPYLDRAFYSSYITYSLLAVVAVALLAFFYRDMSTRLGRLSIVVLMVVFVLTISHLYGRSGYLALAVLSPWMCITMFGRRGLIPIFCGLLLLFTLMLTSQRVRERVTIIPVEIEKFQSAGNSETSVGVRLMLWKDALDIFKQYPLIGAGTGAYQFEAKKINPANGWPHPHNSFLYILASYGMLGIWLYSWLFAVTLRRSWRARGQLSGHSILAFLFVILIGSLTDTQFLSAATGTALGFVVGIPTQQSTKCAS